ncbi:MAG: hypothetical protein JNM17_40805 [Archangium sp.]|nr:hypothetical protein [Archangium sp.]
MFLPLLVATVLSADPVAPPPSPPPLVSTEAATPLVEANPLPRLQERPVVPRTPKRGLTIAGVAVFGASYGLSLGIAAIAELAARSVPVFPARESSLTGLFVPVVGPIIAASDFRNSNDGTFGFLMICDTVVQAAGLTMLIIGLALPDPAAVPAKPTVWLAPTFGAHGAGASLGGTF